jgi:hypothetical protein
MRIAGSILLLLLLSSGALAAEPCRLSEGDAEWIQSAIRSWDAVSRDALLLPPSALPWIVFFDDRCTWHINPHESAIGNPRWSCSTRVGKLQLRGVIHGGSVVLPGGEEMPVQIASFASTWGDDGLPYLAMALPPVWRTVPRHATDPDLQELTRSVFIHEMTHTRQAGLHPRIEELRLQAKLDDLDDDIVQTIFSKDPEFSAAIEREREAIYAAAGAADAAERRRTAAAALALLRERRATHFTGEHVPFSALEEIFLTMEGVANWAAYRGLLRDGRGEAEARALIRRGGKYWSQDLGLGLFLLLDALTQGWQQQVLGSAQRGVTSLLQDAVTAGPVERPDGAADQSSRRETP